MQGLMGRSWAWGSRDMRLSDDFEYSMVSLRLCTSCHIERICSEKPPGKSYVAYLLSVVPNGKRQREYRVRSPRGR